MHELLADYLINLTNHFYLQIDHVYLKLLSDI